MLYLKRHSLWAAFARFVDQQKDNTFLYIPICFGLGIVLYFTLLFEPPLYIGGGLSLFFLLLFALFRRSSYSFKKPLQNIMMALCLLSFGFFWSGVQTARHSSVLLTKTIGITNVEGRIVSRSFVKENLSKVILDDVVIEGKAPFETPSKIRLRSYHFGADIPLGARVQVLASLSAPARPLVTGSFDFQRHSFFQGIGASGYTLGAVEILSDPQSNGLSFQSLTYFFEKMRETVNDRIDAVLAGEYASLTKALITGDRAGMKEDDYEALRVAGLAHLLAISGLHIGLVSGFVFVFLRLFFCICPPLLHHYPVKKWAAGAAMFSAVFYMMLAGATIPTQRAAFMSCLFFLAIILDRRAISLRLVAMAAMVVLLISPYSLLSPSFQLSFAAVTALVAFYEALRRRRNDRQLSYLLNAKVMAPPRFLFESWRYTFYGRGFFYMAGIMLTSLIAGCATSLFAIYHFGHYHAYGLLGNVLALPLVSLFIMPMAVGAIVLWPISYVSTLCLKLMGLGLEWVMFIARGIQHFPNSSTSFAHISLPVFLCLSAGFVGLCILRGRGRFIFAFGAFILAALFMLFNNSYIVGVVHEDAKTISLYKDSRLYTYGRGLSNFDAEQLNEFYGMGDDDGFEGTMNKDAPLTEECSSSYCVFDVQGRKIALVFDMNLYYRLCENLELRFLIATKGVSYADECRRDDLISLNFFDMWRYGSYAIIWDGALADLRVKSVEGYRGKRPWTTRWQRAAIKKQGDTKNE